MFHQTQSTAVEIEGKHIAIWSTAMTRSTTIAEFLVLVIVVALIGPCTAGELKHLPPIQDRPILFNQGHPKFVT